MKVLDRYIRHSVGGNAFLVMLALLAIFSFFQFVDELDSIGQGRYGFLQALQYVFLSMPSLSYEMFPVAALIGSLIGLGTMNSNSEITVMRAAGVSLQRVVFSVLKAGAIIVVIAVLIGEFVAPPSETFANHRRSVAINDQIALKTKHGFWARDGNDYINIRRILPGDRVEDIYIYAFDENDKLQATTHATDAFFRDGKWVLENVEQVFVTPERVTRQHLGRARWDSLLRPELVSLVVIEPSSLSMWDLTKTIRYLRNNDQNSLSYEQALWTKMIYPFSAGVMVLLAIPLVLRSGRNVSVGQRVVLGAAIGLAFRMLSQAANEVGVLYQLPPMLSVSLPTVIMLLIAGYLTYRTSRASA